MSDETRHFDEMAERSRVYQRTRAEGFSAIDAPLEIERPLFGVLVPAEGFANMALRLDTPLPDGSFAMVAHRVHQETQRGNIQGSAFDAD